MLIFQLAALTFTAAVLCLTLKKDQPAFAFLVSVCAAAGVLAAVLHQAQPCLLYTSLLRRSPSFVYGQKQKEKAATNVAAFVVENTGIEPVTSCMPCKRSPS